MAKLDLVKELSVNEVTESFKREIRELFLEMRAEEYGGELGEDPSWSDHGWIHL